MKIVTIVGARPQFVKAGIVSLQLKKIPDVKEIIVHTGQHFDKNMSDIFLDQLSIPVPKYNLGINNMTHGAMTGRMIEGIEEILLKEKPDYCMVYGDTNSTIAGALAAKKLHIKLIHIEAGLRSHNMKMPEEINRILTDRISDILFCPTEVAFNNLIEEGFEKFQNKMHLSGDVMEDAALYFYELAKKLEMTIDIPEDPYILVTLHRAENTDNPRRLKDIITALNKISGRYNIIFPIHPRTAKILESSDIPLNFRKINPVGYFEMLSLIKNSSLVMTDSGGLQKEAFFFRKYCITLREETEWIELLENGYNYLAGANPELIEKLTYKYFNKKIEDPKNLYGNGKAAEYICNTIQQEQ